MFDLLKYEFVDKEVFASVHNKNHIAYCEVLIAPDGKITYAVPSHVEACIRYSQLSREVIDILMPITAGPIQWLVSYTKCVAVYYDFYMRPEIITKDQQETLHYLKEQKCVAFVRYTIARENF